jgi:hypothetical protein
MLVGSQIARSDYLQTQGPAHSEDRAGPGSGWRRTDTHSRRSCGTHTRTLSKKEVIMIKPESSRKGDMLRVMKYCSRLSCGSFQY